MTNAEYLKMIGHRDVIGKMVAESLRDAVAQDYLDLLDHPEVAGLLATP